MDFFTLVLQNITDDSIRCVEADNSAKAHEEMHLSESIWSTANDKIFC